MLAATAQPQYAAWVMLATVSAGVLVLSRRWYLGTLLLLWLLWCGASYIAIRGRSSTAHDSSVYAQLAILMVAATAVSVLLHHWRTRAITDLVEAREPRPPRPRSGTRSPASPTSAA